MGNFSRDTFDKLKHYVAVRLQQGVPLVDADWNELEDIRKYEVQAFLKWFVGNGVPNGNDGFHIVAIANGINDFGIQGGDGTPEGGGRILVEGWDALIESNMKYTEQPLYNNANLAAQLGVAVIPPLTTPGADRMDTVYLDVWEREVDAQEDFAHLVNPNIGIETCVRVKREWAVRVAEGANTPPASTNGHVFYPLASLIRQAGDDTILAGDITDLRLTGLSIVSQYDVNQMVTDAFGTSYALDHDGQPNLKVSLRDAINAILRGGSPSTPVLPLSAEAGDDRYPHAIEDSQGNIWVFWYSDRSGNYDIWYSRYDPASDTWTADTQLTTDPGNDYNPFAIEDSQGDIWVFWRSNRSGNFDIWYNRYNPASDTWTADTQLTTDPAFDSPPFAIVDSQGDIWVFWHSNRSGNWDIWYNRYNPASDSWTGDMQLTTDPSFDYEPFALVDSQGDIWVFWRSFRSGNYDIWRNRYNPASDSWTGDTALTTDSASDFHPFALVDSQGDIWVFWYSNRSGTYDIWYKRYNPASDSWSGDAQVTTDTAVDYWPVAIEDSQGDIWVFWYSNRSGNFDIWYSRFSHLSGWGRPVQLSTSLDNEFLPRALEDKTGDIWVFWYSTDIWYRKLIPTI